MSMLFETSLPVHLSREEFLVSYAKLLQRYGKSDTRIAALFHEAGQKKFPLYDVPHAILCRDVVEQSYPLKARDVSEYLKSHPAIQMVKTIDGNVNTFLPFQFAGVLCLVNLATGEEPEVQDFGLREGKDIDLCAQFAYLHCYGREAFNQEKEGGTLR